MKEPQKIWDNRYSQSNTTTYRPDYDHWLEAWASLFVPHSTVLDVGCGRGYDTVYLTEFGCRVVSVDFAGEALKIVHKTTGQAKVIQVDIRQELPFSAGQFHAVTASLSLYYFSGEQTQQIIDNIRNSLAADGLLLARFNSVKDVNHGARGYSELGNNYSLLLQLPDQKLINRLRGQRMPGLRPMLIMT
ncbi:class I SAM-dependent methyltransferase [Anaerolineales bacterium HSG25]|nr:class I SAM-dependent methyltransferase [Anaerolineales bacterium HSG25]